MASKSSWMRRQAEPLQCDEVPDVADIATLWNASEDRARLHSSWNICQELETGTLLFQTARLEQDIEVNVARRACASGPPV